MAEVPWHLVLDDIGKRSEALKRKKTNADRIRSMTDEELARWITDELIEPGYCDDEHTYELWLDWLRQEATDGKQD